MQALILAGLLVTQVPLPPPSNFRAALASRVTVMLEKFEAPRRPDRLERTRRLDAAGLALDGREPLTGRQIQAPPK